ncbi:YeaC family protein [Stutzerimonas stutzeri]
MSTFIQTAESITPEIYASLKQALELGKWADGRKLTPEQKEICMQAVIAWEMKSLPEEERTGYMGGQECGSKSKKAEAAIDTSLFAPASGTRH